MATERQQKNEKYHNYKIICTRVQAIYHARVPWPGISDQWEIQKIITKPGEAPMTRPFCTAAANPGLRWHCVYFAAPVKDKRNKIKVNREEPEGTLTELSAPSLRSMYITGPNFTDGVESSLHLTPNSESLQVLRTLRMVSQVRNWVWSFESSFTPRIKTWVDMTIYNMNALTERSVQSDNVQWPRRFLLSYWYLWKILETPTILCIIITFQNHLA